MLRLCSGLCNDVVNMVVVVVVGSDVVLMSRDDYSTALG